MEMFFETLFGLLARPPVVVQRALFAPLAALGHLLGYRGWYPAYTSEPLAKIRPTR
jgi:hypothetical protein